MPSGDYGRYWNASGQEFEYMAQLRPGLSQEEINQMISSIRGIFPIEDIEIDGQSFLITGPCAVWFRREEKLEKILEAYA